MAQLLSLSLTSDQGSSSQSPLGKTLILGFDRLLQISAGFLINRISDVFAIYILRIHLYSYRTTYTYHQYINMTRAEAAPSSVVSRISSSTPLLVTRC